MSGSRQSRHNRGAQFYGDPFNQGPSYARRGGPLSSERSHHYYLGDEEDLVPPLESQQATPSTTTSFTNTTTTTFNATGRNNKKNVSTEANYSSDSHQSVGQSETNDDDEEEEEAETEADDDDEDEEGDYDARAASGVQQQMFVLPAAYDSMSTIMEVSSEASGDEAPVTTPLRVSTSSLPVRINKGRLEVAEASTTTHGSPLSHLSPDDTFRGTLNALAQQVERLRRGQGSDQEPETSTRPGESLSSQLGVKLKKSTTNVPISRPETPSSVGGRETPTTPPPPRRQQSAESLMMIALSPMVSPRVKFSATGGDTGSRPQKNPPTLVEVSNKSTMTAIDLVTMDDMASKYFAQKKSQQTQTIEFDCVQPAGERRAPVSSKSVGVGTEKFTRERFSLLPPTKSRSTQTKSSELETDIGLSETRRFKLTNLDFGASPTSTLAKRRRSREESLEVGLKALAESIEAEKPQSEAVGETNVSAIESKRVEASSGSAASGDSDNGGAAADSLSDTSLEEPQRPRNGVVAAEETNIRHKQSTGRMQSQLAANQKPEIKVSPEITMSSSLSRGDVLSTTTDTKQQQKPSTSTKAQQSSSSREVPSKQTSPRNVEISSDIGGSTTQSDMKKSSQQHQIVLPAGTIPALRTELRVIVEIKDSKQRHRSELTSQAQLVNGKLSKQTEVTTSKHQNTAHDARTKTTETKTSMVTPRDVLDRLEAAGEAHSLLYNQRRLAAEAAIKGAPETPVKSISHDNWRPVSESRVRNEIETDTNRPAGKQQQAGLNGSSTKDSPSSLVLSSDATISHRLEGNDNRTGIDLKSRAIRRHFDKTSNSTRDQVLVESEAGFRDDDLNIRPRKEQDKLPDANAPRVTFSNSNATPASPLPASPVQRPPSSVASVGSNTKSPVIFQDRKLVSNDHPSVGRSDTNSPIGRSPRRQPAPPSATKTSPPTPEAGRPTVRVAKYELEEERDNRRQVSRGGRIIFDDHLRERRIESARSGGSHLSSATSPALPTGQIRSPKPTQLNQSREHSLRPTSASPIGPPSLFADQTSNLSSDPETMDSGFAQSGLGGSASNLWARQRTGNGQSRSQSQAELVGGRQLVESGSRLASRSMELGQQLEEPASLNFMDDDAEDDLMSQFDNQRLQAAQREATSHQAKSRRGLSPAAAPITSAGPATTRATSTTAPKIIGNQPEALLPPPEFRFNDRTELGTIVTRVRSKKPPASSGYLRPPEDASMAARAHKSHHASTKLEQKLASGGQVSHALVSFESDTDSQANTSASQASSRATPALPDTSVDRNRSSRSRQVPIEQQGARREPRIKKQLISKTEFSSNRRENSQTSRDNAHSTTGVVRKRTHSKVDKETWDYSLNVNRMRGDQMQSKVGTYMSHSRRLDMATAPA